MAPKKWLNYNRAKPKSISGQNESARRLALAGLPHTSKTSMQLVADLHLHSRYASGVSPAMTMENIATWALRKGLSLLGTGDCLQRSWQDEIELATESAEPGLLKLKPEVQDRVWARVPEALRRPLRWVVSTEIDCLPPPKNKFRGLHHLTYFPNLESARRFAEQLRSHGDLAEGRPTINLGPLPLLEELLAHGSDCHFAPAHVFNPWFSDLGTIGGEASLDELYVDFTSELLAVETGLTSIPPMCRRVSSLDRLALFSCSDAHSLENLGREYTVLNVELNYDAIFAALRRGTTDGVTKTVKFPLYETRYYLNWCVACKKSFDATTCPKCRKELVTGSRDRLEQIADRSMPKQREDAPPYQQLLPLASVIGNLLENNPASPSVKKLVQILLEQVGHERYILTEASEEEIASASTPQLARKISQQKSANTEFFKLKEAAPFDVGAKQGLLGLVLE